MNGMILFLVVVLIYILMAFSRTTTSNRKPPQNPSARQSLPRISAGSACRNIIL